MSRISSLFAALGGLISGSAGIFTSIPPVNNPVYRYPTFSRRSRIPGKPGKPGDKLIKRAEKRRIGLATLR
jgi:hypothetical protein